MFEEGKARKKGYKVKNRILKKLIRKSPKNVKSPESTDIHPCTVQTERSTKKEPYS